MNTTARARQRQGQQIVRLKTELAESEAERTRFETALDTTATNLDALVEQGIADADAYVAYVRGVLAGAQP